VLFLCSGFFTYRMLVGHLTFHPITLTALAGLGVARRAQARLADDAVRLRRRADASPTCSMRAWCMRSARGNSPVSVILMLHGQLRGHRRGRGSLFAGAVLLSLALGAQRLATALAFLQQFPRDEYACRVSPACWPRCASSCCRLFWRPPDELARPLLAYILCRSSATNGSTGSGRPPRCCCWRAAVRVAKGAPVRRIGLAGHRCLSSRHLRCRWAELAPASLARVLKSQPLLGSSSTLVRWYALYVRWWRCAPAWHSTRGSRGAVARARSA
jgi:hypothetical protein